MVEPVVVPVVIPPVVPVEPVEPVVVPPVVPVPVVVLDMVPEALARLPVEEPALALVEVVVVSAVVLSVPVLVLVQAVPASTAPVISIDMMFFIVLFLFSFILPCIRTDNETVKR